MSANHQQLKINHLSISDQLEQIELLQKWTTLAKKSLWAKSTYILLTHAKSSPVTIQDILMGLVDMLKNLLLKIHTFLAQQQAARCSIQLHIKCLCWIIKSCPQLVAALHSQLFLSRRYSGCCPKHFSDTKTSPAWLQRKVLTNLYISTIWAGQRWDLASGLPAGHTDLSAWQCAEQ